MKEIEIVLGDKEIHAKAEIRGTVSVGYPDRYDGVVINAQIIGSNGHVEYKTCNGANVSGNVARLFIDRKAMTDNKAEFTAEIGFEPEEEHDVKFRASIIEQHKEVESDIFFGRFS
ncbi:hypothetical protein CENSYa_0004 [Cenarchaeum symbiosum A]|uniref:Uncharacterized protein n=1 Tax=Cenarchaeum symbiosum (strain A) TaxID=414004 RepID=A0RTJ6_CENSY|nr:hypothetical protein CENSYa_0004 [Cenarchaeum symbiosum A]